MTTAPYAKLRASLGGGAPSTGVLVGAPGQLCQLSQDPAGLGQSFKYQLRDFPEGFACPAGWSTDAGGVYFYEGITPPSFTLPALPLWGKITPFLTVNNGDPGTSGLPATQFVDGTTVIGTPDPSGNGFEDIAYGESNQWDSRRKWMGALKRNIRRQALGAVPSYSSVPNGYVLSMVGGVPAWVPGFAVPGRVNAVVAATVSVPTAAIAASTLGAVSYMPGFEEYLGWSGASYLANVTRKQFAANLFG